jgi:hypothetical protein
MKQSKRSFFFLVISAKEVIEAIPHNNSLDQFFMRPSHVNFSTVRASYRDEKRKAR